MPLVQRAAGLFPTRLVLDVGVKAGQPSASKQRDPHRLLRGGGAMSRPAVTSRRMRRRRRSLRHQGGINRVDLVGEGIVGPVPVKVDLARGAVRALFRALALVGLPRAEVPRGLQARVQDRSGGRRGVRRVLLGLQFGEFGEGELGGRRRRRRSRLLLRGWRRRGRRVGRRGRKGCFTLGRRWRLLRTGLRRRRIDLDRLGDLVLLGFLLLLDAVDVHRSLLLSGTSRTAHVRRLIDERRRLARDVRRSRSRGGRWTVVPVVLRGTSAAGRPAVVPAVWTVTSSSIAMIGSPSCASSRPTGSVGRRTGGRRRRRSATVVA